MVTKEGCETMTIGQKIKYYREQLGMSQDELAKLCGYSGRSSISKIEKDGADIPQKKIAIIANALQVTPGMLIGDPTEADAMRLKVAALIADLTPEELQKLFEYAAFLRSRRK